MHPVPLALLALLFSGSTAVACGLTVAALAARALLMLNTSRATGAGLRARCGCRSSISCSSSCSCRASSRRMSCGAARVFASTGKACCRPRANHDDPNEPAADAAELAARGDAGCATWGRSGGAGRAALAVWLIWREHPLDILHRLQIAGAGLLLAALAHILPMLARMDWRMLIRGPRRPSFATMLKLVWIRESINGLLPVARIGGEIVSFGLLRQAGVRPATAVASLVADMQLTLISQLVFALVAIGYVLEHVSSDAARVAGNLAIGMAALVPVLLLFALVQHARPFERAMRVLNRVTSGKVVALVGESARTDQSIRMIWRKTGIVVRYLVIWQTLQFVGYALEIWLALYFLGAEPTFARSRSRR